MNPDGSHSTTPDQLANTLIAYFHNIFNSQAPSGHQRYITNSINAYVANHTHAGFIDPYTHNDNYTNSIPVV